MGTRGNFNIVLPVRFRGGVTFFARCHGRPQNNSQRENRVCGRLQRRPIRGARVARRVLAHMKFEKAAKRIRKQMERAA